MNWKPIDTAPRDREILVFSPLHGVVISHWHLHGYVGSDGYRDGWYDGEVDGSDRVFHDYPGFASVPTHWMPLPESPK